MLKMQWKIVNYRTYTHSAIWILTFKHSIWSLVLKSSSITVIFLFEIRQEEQEEDKGRSMRTLKRKKIRKRKEKGS